MIEKAEYLCFIKYDGVPLRRLQGLSTISSVLQPLCESQVYSSFRSQGK